jgi:hypothetical protein
MIINAKKSLLEPLDLGIPSGSKNSVILLPGKSVEVSDELTKSPIVQRAIARGFIAISNYCGFIVGEGVYKITISATIPVAPKIGDLWVDIGSSVISALLSPLDDAVPESFDGTHSHLQILTTLLKGAMSMSVALYSINETVPEDFDGIHSHLQTLTTVLKSSTSILSDLSETVPASFDGIHSHLQTLTTLLKV